MLKYLLRCCIVLLLILQPVCPLTGRKKLNSPPKHFRKNSNHIATSSAVIKRHDHISRKPYSTVRKEKYDTKGTATQRKVVLREITRQSRRGSGVSSYVSKIGKGSILAAGNAYHLTKSALKVSFDLLAGKHVSSFEIAGTWTVNQDVVLADGTLHPTSVRFLLAENKTLVTICNGKVYKSTYTFHERKWPRYCTIQFDARAYQGPTDREPVEMTYKGYFKKSILNNKILLMRGTIHKAYGKFFWRGIKKVGSFKAVKRRYGT